MRILKIEINICIECPYFCYEHNWAICQKLGTGYKIESKEEFDEQINFMQNTCDLPEEEKGE